MAKSYLHHTLPVPEGTDPSTATPVTAEYANEVGRRFALRKARAAKSQARVAERDAMTDEELEAEREAFRQRNARIREAETNEQANARRQAAAIRARKSRALMAIEDKQAVNEQMRQRQAARRATETPQERENRLIAVRAAMKRYRDKLRAERDLGPVPMIEVPTDTVARPVPRSPFETLALAHTNPTVPPIEVDAGDWIPPASDYHVAPTLPELEHVAPTHPIPDGDDTL